LPDYRPATETRTPPPAAVVPPLTLAPPTPSLPDYRPAPVAETPAPAAPAIETPRVAPPAPRAESNPFLFQSIAPPTPAEPLVEATAAPVPPFEALADAVAPVVEPVAPAFEFPVVEAPAAPTVEFVTEVTAEIAEASEASAPSSFGLFATEFVTDFAPTDDDGPEERPELGVPASEFDFSEEFVGEPLRELLMMPAAEEPTETPEPERDFWGRGLAPLRDFSDVRDNAAQPFEGIE
jgi:hypothetical protein